MKLMKLNVVGLAVFMVLGLASFQTYAGSCGGGAHKHEEVKSEDSQGCAGKKAKGCGAKKEACGTKKEACEDKKACCGKEGCGEKAACSAEKTCDKSGK